MLKLAQRHPAVGKGALENPGQLSPGQLCTYYLLPSPSQWKLWSENWKSICGKVWYSYFIIFFIIFYSDILFSIVIQAKLVACYDMATWLWFRCKIHCNNIESNIIPQTYSSPLLDSLWFIFKFFLNSPAAILHIWFFFRDEPIIYESKLIYESSLTSL